MKALLMDIANRMMMNKYQLGLEGMELMNMKLRVLRLLLIRVMKIYRCLAMTVMNRQLS